MHVNSVGTARPNQREIDPETFARSDITVVDTRHGVLNEAGDAIAAADAIVPDEVHELCNAVADGTPRRTDDTQITLFKSVGTGIQDIARWPQGCMSVRATGDLERNFPTFSISRKFEGEI